ncbi:hypothetical protein D6C81_03389, partial [Aureobasidium pullulans]
HEGAVYFLPTSARRANPAFGTTTLVAPSYADAGRVRHFVVKSQCCWRRGYWMLALRLQFCASIMLSLDDETSGRSRVVEHVSYMQGTDPSNGRPHRRRRVISFSKRCQKAWALSNQKWIFRARENDIALN